MKFEIRDCLEVDVLCGLTVRLWGRRLAVEAARAVLRYGFEVVGLARIFAGTDPPNGASIQVTEKLGLRFCRQRNSNAGLSATMVYLSAFVRLSDCSMCEGLRQKFQCG